MKTLKSRSIFWNCLIFIGFLLAGTMWAVSSPPGSSFDETYHIGSIWCSAGERDHICESSNDTFEDGPRALTPFVSDYCFYQGGPASCENLEANVDLFPHRYWDGSKDYRNIYYKTMFLLVGSDTRKSILYMRLLNVVIFSLLLVSTLVVVRPQLRKLLLLSSALSLVPQGVFLVSSINPSGWAITGLMFFWVLLVSLLEGNFIGPRWFIFLLLIITLGLCTSRLEGPYYLIFTSLSIAAFQFKRFLVKRVLYPVISVGILFGVSDIGTRLSSEILNSLKAFNTEAGINFNLYWLIHLVDIPALTFGQNFEDFGPLGGGDILVPSLVPIVQISAILMFLYIANRKFSTQVLIFQVVVFIFLYLTLIRLLALEMTYNAYWVQGRYVLPLVPFIIGFSLYLSGNFDFGSHSHPIRLAVILFAISHAVTLMTIIVRFTNGTVLDTVPWPLRVFQLDSWRYINWLPSGMIWIVGVGSYSIFLWAAYRVITSNDDEAVDALVLNHPAKL